MGEIWLALLLVATLSSVDPASSAISVAEVKTAWETFKPPASIPAEITTCESLPCDSAPVDTAAGGTDLEALCTAADTYLTCAGGCSLTDTQKQQLKAVEDLCKTADLEKAVADITTGGNCDTATCPATAIDSASGLSAKCVAFYKYTSCAKGKCSSTLTDAQKQALKDMEDQCKTVLIADLEKAVADITTGGKCDIATCPTTAIDSASELDAICVTSLTYIECVTTKCTSVDVAALKTPCKDIPLFDFGIALIDMKENCDCESTNVDSASGLNDKCLASLTYIECVSTTKTTGTTCDSVDDADVEALKTPCKDASIALYDFGIALIDIKENCPSGGCVSTAVDGAAGLDNKCLASQTYLTCVKTSCTSVPDDDVEALRTPCKEILFGKAMTTIKGNCDNNKCDSTAVDSASGINAKCLASESYITCVTTTCNTTVPAADVEALKTPCKVSTLSGGDGGDDDGCSILQVSILALMLSLLISII